MYVPRSAVRSEGSTVVVLLELLLLDVFDVLFAEVLLVD